VYKGTKANCSVFTTTAVDGQLVNWDVKVCYSLPVSSISITFSHSIQL